MYKLRIKQDEISYHRISRKDKKKIKKMITKECNLKSKKEITQQFISYITYGIMRNLEVKRNNEYSLKMMNEAQM